MYFLFKIRFVKDLFVKYKNKDMTIKFRLTYFHIFISIYIYIYIYKHILVYNK